MNGVRLYQASWVRDDANEEDDSVDRCDDAPASDPEGWAEFCEEKWGECRPFFFPSTDRIYKSRSAAQRRVDIINRWGGRAELLECVPVWQGVEAAKQHREQARVEARISRLEESIASERAKLAPEPRTIRRPLDTDDRLRALDN